MEKNIILLKSFTFDKTLSTSLLFNILTEVCEKRVNLELYGELKNHYLIFYFFSFSFYFLLFF